MKGSIPPGLRWGGGLKLEADPDTGKFGLTGTPEQQGTYGFTVKVVDYQGETLEQKFTVVIDDETKPDPDNSTLSSSGSGGGCNSGLTLLALMSFAVFRRKI